MHILKAHSPSAIVESLKTPAIISSVIVLPFMIMELVNRRDIYTGFPVVLFVVMWILASAFISILMPILRSGPEGNQNTRSPVSVVPRIGLLILIGWLWVGLVLDQMPCFLGVPNCD